MARRLPLRRPITLARANQLRADLAPAERLVWSMVRADRLAGLWFRRQYPIGPYIADFYCHEAKLVVELDGESHEHRIAEDAERTRYLAAHGLRIFRVSNDDVMTNLEGVGIGIMRAVGIDVETWMAAREQLARDRNPKPPSPCPLSPADGGEGTGGKPPMASSHDSA